MPVNVTRLVRCFQELVSIDAPTLGERAMADALTRRLQALGIQDIREDDAGETLGGNAGNLIAFVPGTLDAPPILLSSHMDTVEPSRGKQAIVHEDGRITSAGDTVLGADDAAGLSAILEALAVIQEEKLPHRPLELVFPVAEESYCIGSRQMDFSRIQSKEAYVLDLDGPIGTAALLAPTILCFRATFHGKASHAGMAPEAGIHAIKAAAAALAELPMGAVDSQTTVNVGTIHGGLATNIVPDTCTIEGEVRGFDHQLALQWLEEIKTVLNHHAKAYGAAVEVFEEVRCVAYHVTEDSPVAERFRRACRKTNLSASFVKTFGGSDNNTFSEHGIHGIVIASAMFGAHSRAEYTTVEDLRKLSELTLALMTDTQ